MKRLFDEHKIRKVTDLGGAWKFTLDPDKKGINEGWQNGLPYGETVIVPSVWNTEIGNIMFEGWGWYERKFTTQGGTLMFQFESVMTEATVWLDGKEITKHYGAFTPFEVIVNGVLAGEHTLVVLADSSFNAQSFPQRYTDWFNYGGIARDVTLNELNGISILSSHIKYELTDDLKSATVWATVELYNAENEALTSPLSVKVGDSVIYSGEISLGAYEKTTVTTEKTVIEEIELWQIKAAKLYTAVTSTATDDLIDKVGFRKIEVKDGDIVFNGKSIELLGVNRHEEHPDWGFAFPAKLMKKDIDLILNMNCNTVRGSHYPNSKIFVDMLDEAGILFWSEIPMWGVGFGEAALKDPVVIARGTQMHEEMVKYYFNHPCIVIWGLHNEIATYLECTYPLSESWSKFLRANGGNRLITHASCHPLKDNDMGFDDFISINLYHGWYRYNGYNGTMQDWELMVEHFRKRREEMGWTDKPVIMSEFGAAALAGYHTPFDSGIRWSEEYQRDILEYCIELFHNTDYMRGTYLWQFTNIRTSPSMDLNRARYFNNKGIVDEYRNPKAAYFKVKELYGKYAEEKC